MKNILNLCFGILVVSAVIYASDKSNNLEEKKQTSEKVFRLYKLHYDNSSGEKGMTTFEYDESGLQYRSVWELLDGSRRSDNYYTFDKKGNIVKKYREFSDNITSTITYAYDEKGNLQSELFERSDSVSGFTQYKYDENGLLNEADCKGLKGWFYGIIKYENDKNGKKIKGNIERDGEKIGTITYTYDDNDNLITELWDFQQRWSQTFTYEYQKYSIHK